MKLPLHACCYVLGRMILAGTLGLALATATGAVPTPSVSADWRSAVLKLAREHFKNPAWGFSHCERDYALARQMASSDGVRLDDDVLFAASYLHDMAAFAPWEDPKRDHSDVAAEAVGQVLKGTGFPMQKLDAVREAIRAHMYYRDPKGPEALYLHDADALDWLGAIGAARILALIDPNGGEPTGPKAVEMLEENLAKTPSRVFSPAGKALVPERKLELERFLAELRHEANDMRTL